MPTVLLAVNAAANGVVCHFCLCWPWHPVNSEVVYEPLAECEAGW